MHINIHDLTRLNTCDCILIGITDLLFSFCKQPTSQHAFYFNTIEYPYDVLFKIYSKINVVYNKLSYKKTLFHYFKIHFISQSRSVGCIKNMLSQLIAKVVWVIIPFGPTINMENYFSDQS